MRTLTKDDAIPDGAVKIVKIGDEVNVYFADDAEIIAKKLYDISSLKHHEILSTFDEEEKQLTVTKHDYNDLLAASAAGVGNKGKTIAETKQAFKDAVIARQSIQDLRDEKLEQINNATTTEEIELIKW